VQQHQQQQQKKTGDDKYAWQKFARIAVTGSPDGVSLLGKPQHDWVTGKPMSGPKGHKW
jgi:hypothetical protein